MERSALSAALKAEALRLGFQQVGICAAVEPAGLNRFEAWLAAGYAGEMKYLPDRAAAYADPEAVLPGARSVVMLAMNYRTAEPEPVRPGHGRVSRYAWGQDYHTVIRDRLDSLIEFLRAKAPQAAMRGVVDTAPLLEREFAQMAGLGWIGKNTLLLNKQTGSWFFLAALLTDLELDYDAAHEADHCGTCRACLDACPTDAFVDAHVLDASRCISYLTIELRSPMPAALRMDVGDWVFGCDICQEVCPWNHRAPLSEEPTFQPAGGRGSIALTELFFLSDEEFRRRYRHTPLWRAKRRGLLRNAAIVLGNQQDPKALPALAHGLSDQEPLVRGAAAWALGRLQTPQSLQTLHDRLAFEADDMVRAEIEDSLGQQRVSDSLAQGGG